MYEEKEFFEKIRKDLEYKKKGALECWELLGGFINFK